MSDEKSSRIALNGEVLEKRACKTCRYAVMERIGQTINQVRLCRLLPPQLVPVMINGVQGMVGQLPQVTDENYCFQYQKKEVS